MSLSVTFEHLTEKDPMLKALYEGWNKKEAEAEQAADDPTLTPAGRAASAYATLKDARDAAEKTLNGIEEALERREHGLYDEWAQADKANLPDAAQVAEHLKALDSIARTTALRDSEIRAAAARYVRAFGAEAAGVLADDIGIAFRTQNAEALAEISEMREAAAHLRIALGEATEAVVRKTGHTSEQAREIYESSNY